MYVHSVNIANNYFLAKTPNDSRIDSLLVAGPNAIQLFGSNARACPSGSTPHIFSSVSYLYLEISYFKNYVAFLTIAIVTF